MSKLERKSQTFAQNDDILGIRDSQRVVLMDWTSEDGQNHEI
jgi:hypothetical protein